MDQAERVAFCGLGIMGGPMAANLARGRFDVSVWTHTPGKAERFASEHDVRPADTPEEAAEGAGAVVTMVVDAPEVESVLLGEHGAALALAPGSLCVDMSTVAPSAARALGDRLRERDLAFLEAPVSGSRPKAEDGTLTIMAGGERETFDRALPLLRAMGERIVLVGPRGHGQMAKVLTNTLGAVNAAALAEGVGLVRRAGIDPGRFLEVASASAGASTVLTLKGEPMFDGRFEPLFKLDHMLKDVRHCLAEAKALGVDLSLGELAAGLYERASDSGHGDDDFAAVVTAADYAEAPEH
jgi:3-hydroxyisobutyrate dehydrogenase-like beta-hydroxyacid dehydrogenase